MDKAAVLDLGAVQFEEQTVLDIRAMELIKWNELRARETGTKGERAKETDSQRDRDGESGRLEGGGTVV